MSDRFEELQPTLFDLQFFTRHFKKGCLIHINRESKLA